MTEAVASISGRKLDARYTLLDKLGAGGQGEVWRAHDGIRGVDIALKVLNPAVARTDAAWSALEHEYDIASRLDHPSILKVFPPDRSGDIMVLPMELASGGDLRRLRGAGFLEIIPVLLEVAQALEHAHERGVVHRDLKPGNVLFDARGRARLADFGVAETSYTSADGKTPAPQVSAGRDTNRHGLSPFTASPAQLLGEPPTPADDIYGLGALAYELLSGYPPYYPHFDKKRAIEERVPQLVPTRQIPPLLSALVTRMLDKNPKRRPRTIREVIDELDAALNDTLTFDFEHVSQSGRALPSGNGPIPLPAMFGSDEPAANMSDGPPQVPEWSQTAGRDRRAVQDRRAKRRDDPSASPSAESTASSELLTNETLAYDRLASEKPATALPDNDRRGNQISASEFLSTVAGSSAAATAASSENVPVNKAADTGPTYAESAEAKAVTAGSARVREDASPSVPSRPGANALARIDAALERSVAYAATTAANATVPDVSQARATSFFHSGAARSPTAIPTSAPLPPGYPAAGDPSSGRGVPGNQEAVEDPSGRAAPGYQTSAGAASAHRVQENPVAAVPLTAHPTLAFAASAHATAANSASMHADPMHASPRHPSWNEIPLDGLPRVARLEPIRPRRWPWVVLGLMAGGAAAVYFWLPRFNPQTLPADVTALITPIQSAISNNLAPARTSAPATAADASALPQTSTAAAVPPASASSSRPAGSVGTTASTAGVEQRLRATRQTFDNRLAMLEARGAGVWGGRDFAMAKTLSAEAVGARDAGNPKMAQDRLMAASRLLDSVEAKAPQALTAQVAAGEKALGSGQQEVAGQAFDLARRIDPSDRRASDGQRRAQNLNGILPLLADAQNAEAAHDYARAAQDYSQALSLDPSNATARSGQSRANAAFGDDTYAKAVGTGFAALGAGRLDEAHESFVKARALKPTGAEASEGLRRVSAALAARGFASIRQRAAGLEAQERWDEAEQAYADVLSADPSLAFAQEGRARAGSRAELGGRLQQLIDRPDRLAAPGVRAEARSLLETAQAQSPSGPVLRSQIARLQILLPGFDRPVRLSLVSDNSTRVEISSIGSFGAFARRDIELRPGKYVVVGTRDGFRDVRREITVAPGQEIQTIRVTCSNRSDPQ